MLWVFRISLSANNIDSLIQVAEDKAYSVEKIMKLADAQKHQSIPLSIAYFKLAQSIATQKNDIDKVFDILRIVGQIYEHNNQLDSANICYHQALQIANSLNNPQYKIGVYTDLAITYRRLANNPKSEDYYLKVIEISKATNNKKGLESGYYGLATLYKNVGVYEKAIYYYLEVASSVKERNDIEREVNALQAIAVTYAEAGDLDLALETIKISHQKSLALRVLLQGTILFDYGRILSMNKLYYKALEKFQTSLSIFKDKKHKPLISRSLFYIADTYAQINEYNTAHQYFEKCQSYHNFMSLKSRSDLNFKRGDLFFKQANYKAAKNAYQKGLDLAEQYKYNDLVQKCHYGLYQVYQVQNNTASALKHLIAYTKFTSALVNEEKVKKIAELQFKYDAATREKEVQSLRLERNRTYLISGALIFILVSLFLIYIIRMKSKNNKALLSKNKQIQSQNVKLKESNEVLHQFTYVVAHDLKEPLRSISSFSNLLHRRYGHQFNKEASAYMKFVQRGATKMDHLLNDLLEYAAISVEKASTEVVDAKIIIDKVIEQSKHNIAEKEAIIKYETKLPAVVIRPAHLTLLIQNLLNNALKFTIDKQPIIHIGGEQKNGKSILFVKDNGIGMDNVYNKKVFKLFYRLNKKGKYDGTGIGLTICKNIVDKYDGEIWFESEKGKGTTFFIALPL